ncbi:hypothetical protein OUZ56_032186 [Daphnia magna]|uniref:Uncharacterized protein n=1 Tax=Daphnia magna TaxID=35525 RepID=A0ABQ9ZWI1_9CRUS|nr:hypothetical protein OUZ56_032186 [Daphnia magna]
MYSTSDPDICRTSDGLPCVMWGVGPIETRGNLNKKSSSRRIREALIRSAPISQNRVNRPATEKGNRG